jgi:hypothetical protein
MSGEQEATKGAERLGVGTNILLLLDTGPLFVCDSARNPADLWTELSRILISIEFTIISLEMA